jgi:hypothetical protein
MSQLWMSTGPSGMIDSPPMMKDHRLPPKYGAYEAM